MPDPNPIRQVKGANVRSYREAEPTIYRLHPRIPAPATVVHYKRPWEVGRLDWNNPRVLTA